MINTPGNHHRKSHQIIGEIYFWTATIHNWHHLMEKDAYKNIVVDSLCHLSEQGKIDVSAFVIMPNHIHLIWRINDPNGKESPESALLKYTAHQFKKKLLAETPEALEKYAVNACNKKYAFWQRDSLPIHLFTKAVAIQKLDYIHNNPLASHWRLAAVASDYYYSSARYYICNEKNFDFLRDMAAIV